MWRRNQPADPAARAARLVTVVATVAFALIVCRLQPWQLFVREGYSNDFYDEQARSFLRLRLAVRPEIPGQEGFLVDGRTYLYYGPFLAFVRMPFALLGDLFAGRLARVSMIIAYASFCTGCFHLVRRVGARWARVVTPWRVAGFVAAAACSPVLFLSGWVSVYHETELWAAVFAVWALAGTVRLLDVASLDRSPTRLESAAAAGPLIAGILTRASVGIGVAGGVCLALLLAAWSDTKDARPRSVRTFGVAAAASTIGFVVHAAINWGKFGSPTKLPGQQQLLSLNDPTRAAWFAGNGDSFFSLRFLETTVVQYLRPDTVRLERLAPFLRYGPLATDRGSYPLETITPSASLTTSATLLLLAAIIGVVVALRSRAWAVLAFTLGGAVAAAPTFTIGFIGNRYLVDMLPMLLAPAALAFTSLTAPPGAWRRVARIGTVALVAWGAWCNVSLALWTQQLKEPGFTEWRYRIDDWVFGNPAPALIDLVPGAPAPRDGVVVLDRDPEVGRCSAVYIAEQGAFVALERSNDGRRLAGTVTLDGPRTLIAGGDNWAVAAIVADGQVRLEAVVDPAAGSEGSTGGASTTGEPIDVPADGRLGFEVIADPVSGQLSATIDAAGDATGDTHRASDAEVFLFTAPQGASLPGATVVLDDDPGDSLCRRLEARR